MFCSVQDARFIKSFQITYIYKLLDGSFFIPRCCALIINFLIINLRSTCSCTTCIVYVNSSKIASFLNCFSFQKADAKVRTFKYILQIISEVFFFFLFLVVSLIEREVKEEEENVLSTVSASKSILDCFRFKSGCKGKNFIR